MAVYSDDRVRRLRLVVLVVLVIAGLLAVFSVVLLAGGEGADADRGGGALGLVIAGLVGTAAAIAFRAVPAADGWAQGTCVATGVVTVLAGLLLLGTWLAFVLPLLGVGLVFLSLVSDPDA